MIVQTFHIYTKDIPPRPARIIGKYIPGVSQYVLDANMQPVPAGVCGELYLGGPQTGRGYVNRPEVTSKTFLVNHFNPASINGQVQTRLYKTGDLCKYLPNGDLETHGRRDNQVKVRGHRIELGQVEAAFIAVGCASSAVLVDDNTLYGFVTPETLKVPELKKKLGASLPDYMIPTVIQPMADFPRTSNGKTDRKKLMADYKAVSPEARKRMVVVADDDDSDSDDEDEEEEGVTSQYNSPDEFLEVLGKKQFDDQVKLMVDVVLEFARRIMKERGIDQDIVAATPCLDYGFHSLEMVSFKNQLVGFVSATNGPKVKLPLETILSSEATATIVALNLLEQLVTVSLPLKTALSRTRTGAGIDPGPILKSLSSPGVSRNQSMMSNAPSVLKATPSSMGRPSFVAQRSVVEVMPAIARLASVQTSVHNPKSAGGVLESARAPVAVPFDPTYTVGQAISFLLLGTFVALPCLPVVYAAGKIQEVGGLYLAIGLLPLGFIAYNLLTVATLIMAKALILGELKEGEYSVRSMYYLRWWMIDRLSTFVMVYRVYLGNSPFKNWMLRWLGAKIGNKVQIATGAITDFDMITIRDGAIIGADVRIRGASVENNTLIVRPVVIGSKAVLEDGSMLLRGTKVGEEVRLKAMSTLRVGVNTPSGTTWAGSPASCVGPNTIKTPEVPGPPFLHPCVTLISQATVAATLVLSALLSYLTFGELIQAMGVLTKTAAGAYTFQYQTVDKLWLLTALMSIMDPIAICLFPAFAGYNILDMMKDQDINQFIIKPIIAMSIAYMVFGFAQLIGVAFIKNITSAFFYASSTNLRSSDPVGFYGDHFTDMLLNLTFFRIIDKCRGSIGLTAWLNLMGAKISWTAKCMLGYMTTDPAYMRVGANSVVLPWARVTKVCKADSADDEEEGGVRGRRSKDGPRTAAVDIGENVILASMSYVGGGSKLSSAAVVAPLSSVDGEVIQGDTLRFGAGGLTQRQTVDRLSKIGTAPSAAVNLLIHLIYSLVTPFVLGIVIVATIYVMFGVVGFLQKYLNPGIIVVLIPGIFLVQVIFMLILSMLIKLVVMPYYTAGEHHVDSIYFLRDLFMQQLYFLNNFFYGFFTPGSDLAIGYLRVLGAKVGEGAVVFTSEMTAFSLISIGNGATIGKDVILSPLTFRPYEDPSAAKPKREILAAFGPISIRTQANINEYSVILGDVDISSECLVGPMTLMSNDMQLRAQNNVVGNPPKHMVSNLVEGEKPSFLENDELELACPINAILRESTLPTRVAREIAAAVERIPSAPKPLKDADVLVTGSTGFVGRYLVMDLINNPNIRKVHCIIRAPNKKIAKIRLMAMLWKIDPLLKQDTARAKKVKCYAGNCSLILLGLPSAKTYDKLSEKVSHVFHSAAQLSYSATYDRLSNANVAGTLNIIEFCSHAVEGSKLPPKILCHVSTQGVCSPDMVDTSALVSLEFK